MDSHKEQLLKTIFVIFVLGIAFSQDYDYPMYSEDNMPVTSFSCRDKIHGGYYADVETDCQMYHVCSRNEFGWLRSVRFLCGNGTVFDQRHLVCQDYRKVQHCRESPKYYRNPAVKARLRDEKRERGLLRSAQFDSGRFK